MWPVKIFLHTDNKNFHSNHIVIEIFDFNKMTKKKQRKHNDPVSAFQFKSHVCHWWLSVRFDLWNEKKPLKRAHSASSHLKLLHATASRPRGQRQHVFWTCHSEWLRLRGGREGMNSALNTCPASAHGAHLRAVKTTSSSPQWQEQG